MTEEQKTFHDMGVDGDIADALARKGITHPFPIQELTLPMALKGADIIGQARTGTGKTLGFGLPLLQRVDTSVARTQALVVVPTRELCIQVANDLEVGSARGVTSIAVYGGVPMEPQIEALTSGVHVVVGTPGRLLDHLNRGNLDLSAVTELVLDEADEMLDMGFLPDVERLIEATPAEGRHTMLFSATMPATIVSLARRYMDKPTFMRAEDDQSDVAPTVDQYFFLVHRMDKPRILARILQQPDRGGVYVFTRTKHMADRLVEELDGLGVPAIPIHGDLRQAAREKNLDKFRDGRANVLVATEVAARGLDVENVTHVVNYDCPDDEKMYLHRIGRTARAGARGAAITFAEHNEVERLKMIRKAVASEHEVEEVFSTSDRLQELFDLPDETPWAHLSRKRKPSRESSSKAGASKGSSRSGGSSRGTKSDSSRGSSRRDADTSPKGADTSAKGADSSSGDERSSGERRSRRRSATTASPPEASTRTRTRERTSDAGDDDASARTRTRSRARAGDDDASSSSSGGSGGRARARARRGDDGDGGDRSRSTSGSSGRTRARSTSEGSDRSERSERSGRGEGDRSERSGNGRDSRGGRGRSGGRSDDRSRGGGRGGDRSRGGDGGQRDERVPGEEPTRRGRDARGDGSPQFARRVKVEHLP